MTARRSRSAAMLSRRRQDPLEGEDEAPALTKDMSDGLEALRTYCQAAIVQRWGAELAGKLYAVFCARCAVELVLTPEGEAFADAFNVLAAEVGARTRMMTERAN